MDEHRERMARLERRLDGLHEEIAMLRKHMDQRQEASQNHMDRDLAALREYTDRGFSDVRRREQARATYWLTGILVVYWIAIVCMMGRLIGLY